MQNKLSVVPLFQSPYQASYLLWDNWRPLSFPTHLPPPSKRLQWKMACKNTLPKLPYLLWWLNIHVKQRVKGRKSIHRMSLGTITVWLRRTSQAVGGQITTMRGYSFSVSKKQLKRNISRKKKSFSDPTCNAIVARCTSASHPTESWTLPEKFRTSNTTVYKYLC